MPVADSSANTTTQHRRASRSGVLARPPYVWTRNIGGSFSSLFADSCSGSRRQENTDYSGFEGLQPVMTSVPGGNSPMSSLVSASLSCPSPYCFGWPAGLTVVACGFGSGSRVFGLFRSFNQARPQQFAVIRGPRVPVMVCGDFSIQPRRVHRIHSRIKNHQVEVPDQDGERCQQCFVPVHRRGGVRNPLREVAQCEIIEPEEEAGKGHHHRAPQEGPIFHFLRVVELREVRLLFCQAKVVAE